MIIANFGFFTCILMTFHFQSAHQRSCNGPEKIMIFSLVFHPLYGQEVMRFSWKNKSHFLWSILPHCYVVQR